MAGDLTGSDGAGSHFQARVAVMTGNGDVSHNKHYQMEMRSEQNGTLEIDVTEQDREILLVIVSLPDYMRGHQSYGYQVRIQDKIAVTKNSKLATIPNWGPTWRVTFDLLVNSYPSSYASVLHFTTGGDCCNIGDRIPSLVLHKNELVFLNAVNNQGNHQQRYSYETGKTYQIEVSQILVSNQVCRFFLNFASYHLLSFFLDSISNTN